MDKRAEKLLKKDTAEAGETVIQLFFEFYFDLSNICSGILFFTL
jgi:hypothetical protein